MTPDLVDCIKCATLATRAKLRLIDAVRLLRQERDVYAHAIEGLRCDAGDKIGFTEQSLILLSNGLICTGNTTVFGKENLQTTSR